LEAHAVARGVDAESFGIVDHRAKPAQAPAKRAAWVVRDVPEELAELLAAVRPAGEDEIGEEPPRLLGRGKLDAGAVPRDVHLAEKPELERCRGRHDRYDTPPIER